MVFVIFGSFFGFHKNYVNLKMGQIGSNCTEDIPRSRILREKLEERATKYPEASIGITDGSSDAVIFPKFL